MALLDDVAVIAKLAAASLDDIGAAAGKASIKAVGVVVDDTAVTPSYLQGFSPARELPIIWKIAKGSLRNKIVFILPVILLLSQFLPWAMTPLLMLGGAYLCYEGAEKVYALLAGHNKQEHATATALTNAAEYEQQMVSGAIRTDFILSAEIMVIALAEVASQQLLIRALSLIAVALLITALVYGVVAFIVKMDDVGLKLAQSSSSATRGLGRGLVKAMPVIMSVLSVVGTAAMLWVGGHILISGANTLGWHAPAELLHHAVELVHGLPLANVLGWLIETLGSAVVGVLVGGVLVGLMHLRPHTQKDAEVH